MNLSYKVSLKKQVLFVLTTLINWSWHTFKVQRSLNDIYTSVMFLFRQIMS